MFRTALLAGIFSVAALGVASAAPMYQIAIYNGTNHGGSINDPLEQALPTNPLFSTSPLYTGTYTGAVDFNVQSGTDNIGTFIASGSGSLTTPLNYNQYHTTLSTSPFAITTGIELTFTTTSAENLAITHDDGVSLFAAGSSTALLDQSGPTNAETGMASLAANTTYHLYYIEANGLPAELNVAVTPVPEPASLALLGAGLFGLGFIRRRRGKAS